MATQRDIEACLNRLAELVESAFHPSATPKIMRHEKAQIRAALDSWLKTFCCLNLNATAKHWDRVWHFLKQRFVTVHCAVYEKRALLFDVLVLSIVSRGGHTIFI